MVSAQISATEYSAHAALLLSAVRQLHTGEVTHIKAILANYPTPDAISGIIPHATAIYKNRLLIVTTATYSELCQAKTSIIWQTLFLAAVKTNAYFIAVVSNADAELAETVLYEICGEAANAMIWSA